VCVVKTNLQPNREELGTAMQLDFALRCGRLQDCRPNTGLQEFDSVQVERAVSNDGKMANRVSVTRRLELHFNLRSHGKIRDGEKTHSATADVDSQRLQVSSARKDLDGTVPPLARRAARNGLAAEEHEGMAARLPCAVDQTKITKGHRREGLRRATCVSTFCGFTGD